VTATGYREGARLIAPISIAVFAFGATFGVLARAAGMGIAAPRDVA
jgi:predicted branched-subunit amino acid permease